MTVSVKPYYILWQHDKEVLKRMELRKTGSLDGIPIEVQRYVGEMNVRLLIVFFNKI